MNCENVKKEIIARLKTYILQFIYKDGNGWAFVNAYTVNQAETIFKNQTKYESARVTGIKETKWYGDNMQLVFEGAVTTIANTDVNISIDDIINKTNLYERLEEYIQDTFNLDTYYTKDEIDKFFEDIKLPDLDLSDYAKKNEVYTKQEVYNKSEVYSKAEDNTWRASVTPSIRGDYWFIGSTNTGIRARGTNGTNGSNGTNGVGIANIEYNNGVLTITPTSGAPYVFNIGSTEPGDGDDVPPVVIPVTQVGMGPLLKADCTGSEVSAQERASSQTDVAFQWILDQVVNGERIRKVLWHTTNGTFIDALGYEIVVPLLES